MTKIIGLFGIVLLTSLSGCEEKILKNQEKIEGIWIFKEFFLGDAILSGCGWEAEEVREMSITIKKEGEKYEFSGFGPVNNYFGSFDLLSLNENLNQGKIKVDAIGSTKMAGPEPLMQCESMYFEMLQEASDIGFSEDGELRIGRFRTSESSPRDGGTFMVFEKAKLE